MTLHDLITDALLAASKDMQWNQTHDREWASRFARALLATPEGIELTDAARDGLALRRLPDDFPLTVRYDPPPAVIAWTVEVADRTGYGDTVHAAITAALEGQGDG